MIRKTLFIFVLFFSTSVFAETWTPTSDKLGLNIGRVQVTKSLTLNYLRALVTVLLIKFIL